MAPWRSSGRPWLWPASRKFAPSLPWTSRTPPNAWPPALFQLLKLYEFIPISAASALNPASVNSSSAALRIPSSIASAPTASSSPPSPTPPNLDKLPSPHVPRSKERSFDSLRSLRMTILRRMVRCRGRRLGRFDPALRSQLATAFRFLATRHSPLATALHNRWSAERRGPATRRLLGLVVQTAERRLLVVHYAEKQMPPIIKTRSTSPRTSKINTIVLREGKLSRLVFIPMLVQNERNPEAGINGDFVYQRKAAKDTWIDVRSIPLNSL